MSWGLDRWELYRHFDLFDMRCRFRNNIAVDSHSVDVELNCPSDKLTRFLQRRGGRDATRKIGNVRAIAGGGRFKKDGIRAHFSPACFSIELCVFGSKSADG